MFIIITIKDSLITSTHLAHNVTEKEKIIERIKTEKDEQLKILHVRPDHENKSFAAFTLGTACGYYATEDINATMTKFEKNVIDKNTVSQFGNTPLRGVSYAVIRYDNETIIKVTDNVSKKVIMANIKIVK